MDWQEALDVLQPTSETYEKKAKERLDNLTKPVGSLGRLEEIAIRMAGIYRTLDFKVDPVINVNFVGDHGITEEGISLYPQEVTTQMVNNFLNVRGAASTILAKANDVAIKVVDVGMKDTINHPDLIQRKVRAGSCNYTKGKAMTEEEVYLAIQVGFEIGIEEVENGYNILTMGEKGIGNTTPSATIAAHLLGRSLDDMVGRGTGLDDSQLNHKKDVIQRAFDFHALKTNDPIDTLCAFGGYEIAAMTGFIIAASYKQVPIVLDGIIAGAAALVAREFNPLTVSYMVASHCGDEVGHKFVLQDLGLKAILDLSLRLGEGTGSILSVPIIRSSKCIFQEMATFDDAGVSRNIR